MCRRLRARLKGTVVLLLILLSLSPTPCTAAWSGLQEGSSSYDFAQGVAVDSSSNVYVAGYTDGSLYNTNAGTQDLFVAKFNSAGTRQWAVQEGTSSIDRAYGVAVDSSSNVYVAGYTDGSLYGTNAGSRDLFVAKFNSAGTRQWGVQEGSSSNEGAYGVAVDSSSNVYVAGWTRGSLYGTNAGNEDLFVANFNSAGTRQWGFQEGSSSYDVAQGVAVDSSSNVYVAGNTYGSLYNTNAGSEDLFVSKFNSAGTRQWGVQEGSSSVDRAYGVAVDSSSNVYVAGHAWGSLYGTFVGGGDLFVAKFNSAGTRQWGVQEGSSSDEGAYGVAVDSSSNVYVAGGASGSLYSTNAGQGSGDLFVAKFNSAGTRLSAVQTGTSSYDVAQGVAVDSSSNVYVAGNTQGSLYGTNAGIMDLFVSHLGWCPAGQAFSSGICVSCTAGSYSLAGYLSCEACAAGTISESNGAVGCTQCQNREVAPSAGLTSCTLCTTPGIRANDARTACDTVCPAGQFCLAESLTTSNCPIGTFTTEAGATAAADCLACIEPATERCPGTGSCGEGYAGRMCSSCDTNYFWFQEACIACPADTWYIYVALVVFTIVLVFVLYMRSERDGVSWATFVRYAVLGTQVKMVTLRLGLGWPTLLQDMSEWLSSYIPVLNLSFASVASSPECDMGQVGFYERKVVEFFYPIVAAVLVALVSACLSPLSLFAPFVLAPRVNNGTEPGSNKKFPVNDNENDRAIRMFGLDAQEACNGDDTEARTIISVGNENPFTAIAQKRKLGKLASVLLCGGASIPSMVQDDEPSTTVLDVHARGVVEDKASNSLDDNDSRLAVAAPPFRVMPRPNDPPAQETKPPLSPVTPLHLPRVISDDSSADAPFSLPPQRLRASTSMASSWSDADSTTATLYRYESPTRAALNKPVAVKPANGSLKGVDMPGTVAVKGGTGAGNENSDFLNNYPTRTRMACLGCRQWCVGTPPAVIGVAMELLFFFMPTQFATLFDVWDCTKDNVTGAWVLRQAPDLDCFNSTWGWYFSLTILALLLYLVPFLLLLCCVPAAWIGCRRSSAGRRLHGLFPRDAFLWLIQPFWYRVERQSPMWCPGGRLCGAVRPGQLLHGYHFELMYLGYRILLVALVTFAVDVPAVQLGVGMAATIVVLSQLLILRPFRCENCPGVDSWKEAWSGFVEAGGMKGRGSLDEDPLLCAHHYRRIPDQDRCVKGGDGTGDDASCRPQPYPPCPQWRRWNDDNVFLFAELAMSLGLFVVGTACLAVDESGHESLGFDVAVAIAVISMGVLGPSGLAVRALWIAVQEYRGRAYSCCALLTRLLLCQPCRALCCRRHRPLQKQ